MKHALLIFAGVLLSLHGYAQIDTEFWFAAPEVTSGHGDRPIYLRISTLQQGAAISVTQPARGNAQIAAANIPANTTHTIDLTARINDIETVSPAVVLKTGLRIVSSAPITAYYEVGSQWNSDIFPLKGRNALGNKFVIPSQNFYDNSGEYSPTPSSSFDIVASQNNTVIKVRPTKPLLGHLNDTLIIVKLNAGETYSFRKPTLLATDNPGGTLVESNKPIAVTVKDDSVINGTCRDILGDQLVPVAVAGTEYVVLKGFLSTSEYLFITATEDNTKVFLQGSNTPINILSAGQVFRQQITEKSTYIRSDKTIYVFHVTGFGCEVGLAILPSITCKGSPQIGFTRTTSEFFGLNVLVQKEGISRFKLNGSTGLIPASAFTAVPGTNDKWYTAQLSFSTIEIPVAQASLVSNDRNSFQVGIINGNATTTCRYGYFSSFSTLFIGDDLDFCEGDVATLDAGPEKESYLWSTGAKTQTIGVSAPGDYWVKVIREDCVLYDTIKVDVKKGKVDLGPDLEVCRGDTARVDGKENFSWQWSDGSKDRFLETKVAGKYWASVFDYTGCSASDTVMITLKELPPADLGEDIMKCRQDDVLLNVAFGDATYLWQDSVTTSSRNIDDAGLYSVRVAWNGCNAFDSILIENMPGPPQDSIFGTPSVCPYAAGIGYEVEAIPNSTYKWLVNGGVVGSNNGSAINVDWFDANPLAKVQVIVTDGSGCEGDTIRYAVRVNVVLLPEIPFGPDTLCLNKSKQVVYTTPPTNGSVFHWTISGGEISSGQDSPTVVVNWSSGRDQLTIEETSVTTDTVCRGLSLPLNVFVFKDSAHLDLEFVSVDTTDSNLMHVDWFATNRQALAGKNVLLHKRPEGSLAWQLLASVTPDIHSFQDQVDFTADAILEYYLSTINSCDEPLETPVHSNIFLAGYTDTTEVITLRWSHYFGWPAGVEGYQIWRKADNEPGYRFLATVSPLENSFSGTLASDAFNHRYVIRAIEKDGVNESWSNPVMFEFDHPVVIPNVITPNGDDYNQYFHISKIELYRNSILTILDRWGRVVYQKTNYQNDFDGRDLSPGVYFYVLDLKRDNKVYKGPLTIF
jgi:gliding motility-associated-like protein